MAQFAIPIAIALVATAAVFILTQPKGQNSRGPRIGDLKVTDSAYGKPIPILRGMGRVGGNIIQASDLREISHTTSVGGGKGGGSSNKQTSYTAEVDFAMMIGEGEIGGLLRIWFDGKIVYDATSGTDSIKKPGLTFRFYPGSETQLPDPLIESLVGEALAPAYRGTAYIVFESLQLADYGNRPPQVTVEYAEVITLLQPYKVMPDEYGITVPNYPDIIYNEDNRKGYFITNVPGHGSLDYVSLVEFDMDTMLITRKKLISDMVLGLTNAQVGVNDYFGVGRYDNRIYISLTTFSFVYTNPLDPRPRKIVAIDATTFTQDTTFTVLASADPDGVLAGGWNNDYSAHYSAYVLMTYTSSLIQVKTFDLLGSEKIFNVFVSFNNSLAITQGNALYAVINNIFLLPASSVSIRQTFGITGASSTSGSDVWFVVGGNQQPGLRPADDISVTGDIHIGKMTIASDQVAGYAPALSGVPLSLSDVGHGAVAWGPLAHLFYDPADDSLGLIVQVYTGFTVGGTTDSATRICLAVKWHNGVVWSTQIPDMNANLRQPASVTPSGMGNTFQYISLHTTIVELNLNSGTYTSYTFAVAGDLNNIVPSQYFSPSDNTILTRRSTGEVTKLYLGRAGGNNVAVADIVTQLSLRAGLTADDIDVTAITGSGFTVGGFQATKPSSARANIEPLEVAFSFYSVESDYKVKFIPKDGAIAPVNIAERYLVQQKDGSDVLEEKRIQEIDLPAYVGITFMDQNRDYDSGTVPVRRPSNPSSTMLSNNRLEIELPLVWDYQSVKQVAEKSLYSAWQERVNYKGRIAWDYLWIDPGDEIHINMDNGDILPQRISKQSIGADLTMEVENVSSDVATYSSITSGDGGITPIRKSFSSAVKSRIFILDMPLLSDTHNPPAGLSMDYYGMAGYGAAGWRGAIMFKSPDDLTWIERDDTVIETAYGTLANAMPDNLDPFATDSILSLDVYMVTGEERIQSVTYSQMLAGSNHAAIVKNNGEIEVIQFQTAVDLGSGHFTLTGINRGRRGTNVFCGGHTTSELFILLTSDEAIVETIALSEIGAPFYFRAVTLGTLFQDAPISSSTSHGNDLKPYMPTHFTAKVVSTDIQFDWVRNTRLGGALVDLTGVVPLSESSELYDLEIYSGPGGTIKRTFSGLTSPTKLYLNADIVTDFGSIPASITFRIYQISALVGRGLTRELTVGVL